MNINIFNYNNFYDYLSKTLKAFATIDNVGIGDGSGSSSSLPLPALFLQSWIDTLRYHFCVFHNVFDTSKVTCIDVFVMSISLRFRSGFSLCADSQQFNIKAEVGHPFPCVEYYFC